MPEPFASRHGAGTTVDPGSICVQIEPIVARAQEIAGRVEVELPEHPDLAQAALGVARIAREAQDVSRRLRRPFGLHRLPAAFLMLALFSFATVIYLQFFHVSTLRIAVSSRDAVELKSHLDQRVRFVVEESVGSRESLAKLKAGTVDLAFVQGGVPIPEPTDGRAWIIEQIPSTELILLFLRQGTDLKSVRRILTSSENQGSHSLCQVFLECWGLTSDVRFLHDWREMTDDENYRIPADIDAIFVVKDPLNSRLSEIPERLDEAGFELSSPYLGAYSLRLPYLAETSIRAGFLDPARMLPANEVPTYSVGTYLVVSPDLSPRQLAAVSRLVHQAGDGLTDAGFEPTVGTTSELLQGVEAAVSVVIYIGLAFLALLGLDAFAYRRRFNELNSLISLISLQQSTRDALSGDPRQRAREVAYLRVCSDLLGLISVVGGYYTQENSTLMYNRQLDVIHERAASLKINIQLKILHAQIPLSDLPAETSAPSVDANSDDTIRLPRPRGTST